MGTLFPSLKKPYILGHRGAAGLAPENTLAACAVADVIGVDFLDIDVHMTRDGHLVGIHDETVDRTTNGRGRVDSYTLEELQKLDAGYRFQDAHGAYSYRGKGVTIPALEEIFEAYAGKYYLHFEIKAAYPRKGPSQIEAKLWELIARYRMEDRTVVGAFDQAIVERFQRLTGGRVVVEAGRIEVANFVLANKFRLPALYRHRSNVLSIPLASSGISLKDRRLIAEAHRLGMEVYYWTIDDPTTMQELIELDADGIFTNRPDLLKKVLRQSL